MQKRLIVVTENPAIVAGFKKGLPMNRNDVKKNAVKW